MREYKFLIDNDSQSASVHFPGGCVAAGPASHASRFYSVDGTVVSRKAPSFAVAWNCGMGSNSLNAEVKALDGLHIVRGWNSSYFGLK